MKITVAIVKELRERTGAGMMECKKALVASEGDIDAAIELMRKSGQAKADKKASRVAAEGLINIGITDDCHHAVIVEVNCETDFVARDQNFIKFVDRVTELALAEQAADVAALLATSDPKADNQTMDECRRALIAKLGENITIRRLTHLHSDEPLGHYLHGTRIGVVVATRGGDSELRKDLAMHIAANSPLVVSPDDVPADKIAKEKEIFLAQAESSGKPKEIIEKMTAGRIKKYLDEISLLGQPFVKDPNVSVSQLLADKRAEVIRFVRYGLGEGIEKKSTNFANEVMAQVRGSDS